MAEAALPIPQSAVPVTQEDAFDFLRLIRCERVGPVTCLRLLREYGSPTEALRALPDIAGSAGISKYRIAQPTEIKREIQSANALGVRFIFLGTPEYPAQLYDLPDPPPTLWTLGDTALLNRPLIALVGARNASAAGLRMAARLAKDLGALGYATVSGLARGIDAGVHENSLETGTIAVQAGGVDVIYPKENNELALRIAEAGLRISEMPFGFAPQSRHFPRRNRIISGLAKAVIVVEAAAKSGSLITARNALDQGREVMAVPGNPLDPRASGSNFLIREGATLIRHADDVAEALGAVPTEEACPSSPAAENQDLPPNAAPPDGALPAKILALLSIAPAPEDAIVRDTHAPQNAVMAALGELDMLGRIHRQAGGLISLTPDGKPSP